MMLQKMDGCVDDDDEGAGVDEAAFCSDEAQVDVIE